jgi:biopolymer transport protein ExbB
MEKMQSWMSRTVLAIVLGCGASLAVLPAALPARAQEEPAAADAAEGVARKEKNFMDLFHEGGVVMYFLALASVLVMTFTIEGLMKLRAAKLAPPALIARLREAISSGNYQEAWLISKANPSFLGNVVGAGLERLGRSKDAVDFAVQEAAVREGTLLKANTQYLSVIGVVAPMIGLTGTVIGMIKAFDELGRSGITNPSALAAAIGEVLVATASGLVVAIPAFVFFYVLKNFAVGATLVAESQVYKLLDDIPYDQLAGLQIGENFSSAPGGVKSPSGFMRSPRSAKVSQEVRYAAQTSSQAQTMDYQAWLQQVQELNPSYQIDGRDPDLRAVYDSGMTPDQVQFDMA